MIIVMPTLARPQRRCDHRLWSLVQRTGDVAAATDLGVPRSMARGWLGETQTVVVCLDVTELTEYLYCLTKTRAEKCRMSAEIARLRGTPARMEEMLRGVPREMLILKPVDKWSVQEHAGHMLDLESLWMSRVDDFVKDRDTLTVADLSNRQTAEANHNARNLSAILIEGRAARRRLVDHVGKLPPGLFARVCCIRV